MNTSTATQETATAIVGGTTAGSSTDYHDGINAGNWEGTGFGFGEPGVATDNGGGFGLGSLIPSLDDVQLALDVVGLVPVLGEPADVVNAAVSVARGNYTDAALSLAAVVPVIGSAATATKWGGKATNAINKTRKARASRNIQAAPSRSPRSARAKARSHASQCNSFVPGTSVLMANRTAKPIEDVQLGDLVWAADPETGEEGPREVTRLITGHGDKTLVDIEIDGDTVTATDHHPIWVNNAGEWVDAEDLQVGDYLLDDNGVTLLVNHIDIRHVTDQTVHNLTVDDIHTFYVLAGDDPVLTHNDNCPNPHRNAPGSLVDDLVDFSCRTNSFVPETAVLMASGRTKPIEHVEVGDSVIAKDPETGEAGPRLVTDTIVGDGEKHLIDIEVAGGTITATGGHPFWVDDEGLWIDAEELSAGDLLLLSDGSTAPISHVTDRVVVQRVHNLTVQGIHTYFVEAGDEFVLVHNCRPEAGILGSKKHGVDWAEGPARAIKEGKPQGQWAADDVALGTDAASALPPGQSGYFDLPANSSSVVHMPDGTTIPATRFWVRNNGIGTWHGYPMP